MIRVALISDTHMRHEALAVPEVDVLVSCGDFTKRGTRDETVVFLDWLARQPARAHVVCAGNHDFFAEHEPDAMRRLAAERGVIYLEDEEADVLGLRVWGSPVTPVFRSMAFNVPRGGRIREVWERIPVGLDLLITHGPPRGLGDRTFLGMRMGCDDLRDVVAARAPRVHAFGHIHEDPGEFVAPEASGTRFLNVASSRLLAGTREPVVVPFAPRVPNQG